jgi:plasmid stabilization system protein ParE
LYISKTSKDAQDDIKKALAYYNAISEKLGVSFIADIEKTSENINKAPQRPKSRYENVKAMKLKKFNYFIYYLVDDVELVIKIFAVLHGKQNAENWINRL